MMDRVFPASRARQFAPLAIALIGAAVAVCAYLQALHYPFLADDEVYIVKNHKLAELSLSGLWRLFSEPYNEFAEFLPLREISYWFDLTLSGLNPAAFRIHNISLYLLSLPLVYGATLGVWRYFRPSDTVGAPWAAAAVTALFALHPSHVEAVVCIAGRKDVLSALFSLLAVWLALRVRQQQEFSPAYSAAALLALAAAMLSKATAVAVAPVIAVLWLMFWRDMPKRERSRYQLLLWPLAALLLAACFALIFSAMTTKKIPFYFGVEAVTRTFAILGWLARLAVSPEERHYLYPVFEDPHFPFMVALGVAVLAAAIAAGVLMVRKRSLAGFALFVFLLLCMPSMQLIPYAPPSLVSDRFLTLAAWPAILLIVALSWRLRPEACIAVLLVIALSWGYETARHPRDWRSAEVLLDAELRAHPGYYTPAAYKIYAVQLPLRLYDDAIETAGNIPQPQIRKLMIDLIHAHQAVRVNAVATGDPRKAIELLWVLFADLKQSPVEHKWNSSIYNLWISINRLFREQWAYLYKRFPDDALVNYNAGLLMMNLQRYPDAIVHLRTATESTQLPESLRGPAFQNLGLVLFENGQLLEAESALLAALKLPSSEMRIHCLLAVIYKRTGRAAEEAREQASCPAAPAR